MFEQTGRSTIPERQGLADLSRHNRALIIRTLRDHGPLPRYRLADITGLSRAATSNLVDVLLSDGRLVESTDDDPARVRGRPVAINPVFASVTGLELTNDGHIRGVVLNAEGLPIQTIDTGPPPVGSPEIVVEALATAVRLASSHSADRAPMRAVGVAVPGTVDVAAGVVDWLNLSQNWFDVPLAALLEERTGLPATVDWRAYTATLAEVRFGAGREGTHVLCLYLGEGIGMGIAEHGTMLSGAGNQAGSIAHLRVVSSGGPRCHCGMQGCLWAVASIPAILHRIRDGLEAGVLSSLLSVEEVTFAEVLHAARLNDRLSEEVLEEVAGYVGVAIATCAHVLNPDVVVISGPLAAGADLLQATVERVTRRHTFPWLRPRPEIRFSQLGVYAAARGAATMALDRLLGV